MILYVWQEFLQIKCFELNVQFSFLNKSYFAHGVLLNIEEYTCSTQDFMYNFFYKMF